MRGLNPWTQRLLPAKPPIMPLSCGYQEIWGGKPPFTRYVKARGDPPSGPGLKARSRGDPGG